MRLLSRNLTSLVMGQVVGCFWLDYYKITEHPTGDRVVGKSSCFF